jgi:hypothetical protein
LRGVAASEFALTGPRNAFPKVNLNGDLRAARLLPNEGDGFVDLVFAIFVRMWASPRTPFKRAKYNFSKSRLRQVMFKE